MACCIFMAIVITNIMIFYRKFRAFFGFKAVEENHLWQSKTKQPSRWRTSIKVAAPAVLISLTVVYGAEHLQHLAQWLGDADCSAVDLSECHVHNH